MDSERTLALAACREVIGPVTRLLRAERAHCVEQLVTARDRRVAELQGAIHVIDETLRALARKPTKHTLNSYS